MRGLIAVMLLFAFHACAAQAQSRDDYISSLEREFLSRGYSFSIYENGKSTIQGAFTGPPPSIIVFGYISKSIVFRAVKELRILEKAKEGGYGSVTFIDRGNDGLYTFDLSKSGPVPRCALRNRICF